MVHNQLKTGLLRGLCKPVDKYVWGVGVVQRVKSFSIHKRRMVQSFHLRVDRRVWPNPTWEWFSISGIVLSLRYLSSVVTLWVGFSRNRSTYMSSCWAAQTRIDFILV